MKAGLQLWSLRDCFDNDIKKKLAYAAECGFESVEFAGFGGLDAEEMKKELARNGLIASGSHSGADVFQDSPEEELDYLKAIGAKYMILPWAKIETMQEVDDMAELLNKTAKLARSRGIKIGYHNHAGEFEKIEDKYILDLLMEKTSDDVIFEVDVFWAAYAGLDPYKYVESKGSKVELIHMKQIGEDKKNVMLPDGKIDFKKVISSAKYSKGFIVEQEGDIDKILACKVNGKFVKEL